MLVEFQTVFLHYMHLSSVVLMFHTINVYSKYVFLIFLLSSLFPLYFSLKTIMFPNHPQRAKKLDSFDGELLSPELTKDTNKHVPQETTPAAIC